MGDTQYVCFCLINTTTRLSIADIKFTFDDIHPAELDTVLSNLACFPKLGRLYIRFSYDDAGCDGELASDALTTGLCR